MARAARIGLALLAAAAALASSGLLAGCMGVQQLESVAVEEVPLSAVRDGTYRGVYRTFPVTARVRVTVEAGRIAALDLRGHFHGPGHGGDAIVDRVLAAQSLQVDAVSGATYSSKVILLAVREALEKGR